MESSVPVQLTTKREKQKTERKLLSVQLWEQLQY